MGVPIDRHPVLVKEMCSLAGIAHSVKCFWVTHLADQGAAKEALEIERNIWPQAPDFAEPGKQMFRHGKAPEVSAGEDVNVIDIPVATQEGGPLWVNHPGDLGFRISSAEKGRGRKGMNNVA
jgi:hypothetical protein